MIINSNYMKKVQKKVFKYLWNKSYDKALDFLNFKRINIKLINYRNHSFFYSLYGVIKIFTKEIKNAKFFLNKALQINSNNLIALNALAYIFLLENKLDKAVYLYLYGLKIKPNYAIIKRNLFFLKKYRNLKNISFNLNPKKHLIKLQFNFRLYFIYLFIGVLILLPFNFYKDFFKKNIIFSSKYSSLYLDTISNYKSIKYLTEKQIIDKKKIIIQNSNFLFDEKLLKLIDEILVSNISINEKIKFNHFNRKYFIRSNYLK